ncbi:PDDEXK family nuclease [Pseudomonas hunanensis]|uniref:hypothetical protein n=1 Tax=Pseudomonas hunanensis TaxID=1247546 RepID=UPI0037F12ADD
MKEKDRFDVIMKRQAGFQWGDFYVPSSLAVPREAPRGSRASRLYSHKLIRTVHALSAPERVFTQLALHHPNLFELHEQKMLWPVDAPHPLQGHPQTKGQFLPPLRGTVSIAAEIGFKHHAIIVTDEWGERIRQPYPYLGDLLLYLENDQGRAYAINWTVKDTRQAFAERRARSPKTPVQRKKDREHAQLRGRLERLYYASAGIQTIEVAKDEIPAAVEANLDLLFNMHGLPVSLDQTLLEDFACAVQEAVRAGDPLNYLAICYSRRWGNSSHFIAKIYQDIWERRIVVDFNKPILIDHPLNTDGPDLLDQFNYLFEDSQG